jgi:hypothetical protein
MKCGDDRQRVNCLTSRMYAKWHLERRRRPAYVGIVDNRIASSTPAVGDRAWTRDRCCDVPSCALWALENGVSPWSASGIEATAGASDTRARNLIDNLPHTRLRLRRANVLGVSRSEAPRACGQSGTRLAADCR